MRLRNIKGSRESIGASPYVVHEPEQYKGKWNTMFEHRQPLRVEVGMGKGKFLMAMAAEHPEMNYIGIEKYSSVLVRALQKQEEAKLPNVKFLRMEAEYLPDVFGPGEIDRIYLNFSDPWPKDRHAKRRLTSREFFQRYDQILAPGGQVEFKTDNRTLFEFSLEEVENAGWRLKACTYDLHRDMILCEGNVMTEYEEKFSSQGNPICKLIAARK